MKRLAAIAAIALILASTPAHAGGGPSAGAEVYNAYVVKLTNVGCSLRWTPTWGSSWWSCPRAQVWHLRLHRDDTVTLRRVR